MSYIYSNGKTIFKCLNEEARNNLAKLIVVSPGMFNLLKERELPISRYFFTENTICKYNSIPHPTISDVEIIDIIKINRKNKNYIFGLYEAQTRFREHCENLNILVNRGLIEVGANADFNIEDVETDKFEIEHSDGSKHTYFYRFVYDNYDKLEYYCDF